MPYDCTNGYLLNVGTSKDSFDIVLNKQVRTKTFKFDKKLPENDSIFVKIQPFNSFDISPDCSTFVFYTKKCDSTIIQKDTLVEFGSLFMGVSIERDTILETNFEDETGCPAKIVYDIKIRTSSIERSEDFLKKQFKVFPNPANEIITIKSNIPGYFNSTQVQYDFFSIDGISIYPKKIGAHKFSLKGIQPGIFVIRIDDSENVYFSRFIKL